MGTGNSRIFLCIGSSGIPYLYSVSLLAKLCEVLLEFPKGLIKIFGLFHFM